MTTLGRGGFPFAELLPEKGLVVDTLTTRFLLLFLFMLFIPLIATIIFTLSLLTNHIDKAADDHLLFSRNLFDAAVDEARDRLDLIQFTGKNSIRILPRYAFVRWNGRLYLKLCRKFGSTEETDWNQAVPIDNVLLNRIYRRQPALQTEIWILPEPLPSAQALREARTWLARGPRSPIAIPEAEVLNTLRRRRLFLPVGQPVTMEINRIPYRLVQQTIYSMRHEKIAQVLHVLPLAQNQMLLGHYYLGIYAIAVAGLIFSVLLAMLAARTITQPLLRLIREVNTLSRENVMKDTDAVTVSGVYEIRQLGEAFNRMVKRLRQEHTLKDEFVATLTHDLKVPLLAEKQTLAYFMKRIYGPLTDEQTDVLDVLQSSNRSCLSLVNGLLEVYRYDSGAAPLVFESFNLWLLMEETIGELQSLAQEKELTLTLQAEPEDALCAPDSHALVYADRMEIKRVLHNLISNAIINTASLGSVDCRLINPHRLGRKTVSKVSEFRNSTLKTPLRTEGRLLVTIRDSGVGFTNEDLPNLFKRFAAGRGRHPMSLGLGLYNCYQVVQAHNGVLWVESAEGEGSAVNFLLPCTQTVAQDRRIRDDRRRSAF